MLPFKDNTAKSTIRHTEAVQQHPYQIQYKRYTRSTRGFYEEALYTEAKSTVSSNITLHSKQISWQAVRLNINNDPGIRAPLWYIRVNILQEWKIVLSISKTPSPKKNNRAIISQSKLLIDEDTCNIKREVIPHIQVNKTVTKNCWISFLADWP